MSIEVLLNRPIFIFIILSEQADCTMKVRHQPERVCLLIEERCQRPCNDAENSHR